jgi:hypothetical protein
MPYVQEKPFAEVSAETTRSIVNARASCEDADEHVRSSRRAVNRSLRTLGRRFFEVFG